MLPSGHLCELMDLVKQAELLVLDDLGAERATEWAREVMLIIVSARLAADRQTMVTTNYAAAGELIERFGGGQEGVRIVSRLFGLCAPVRMKGPDWRLTPTTIERERRSDLPADPSAS